MKSAIALILLLVYTTFSFGINLNLHYCGGELKTVSFLGQDDEEGCCGDEMESEDCCKNETYYLKVKDGHHSTTGIKITPVKSFTGILLIPIYKSLEPIPFVQKKLFSDYHAPPVLYENALYLRYGALLI